MTRPQPTATEAETDYIRADVVAADYGFTISALAQLRYTGKGPKFLKPTPRTVIYRRADVVAWLESSERTITGEA